jgi:hypothetical protein
MQLEGLWHKLYGRFDKQQLKLADELVVGRRTED